MLPDGFHWAPRCHLDKAPNAVFLGDQIVAYVESKEGGGWFVRLEVQKPFEAPIVTRPARSWDTGRAGIETWVCRHEDRLRREVGVRMAARPSNRWCARAG